MHMLKLVGNDVSIRLKLVSIWEKLCCSGEILEYDKIENAEKPRDDQDVVIELEGGLLRSADVFHFFMLVALEGGCLFRALILLLVWPIAMILRSILSSNIHLHTFTFVAFAGLKSSVVEGVSRAVLPKFFLEDLHAKSFEVFVKCRRKYVLTSMPRVMAEFCCRYYLGAENVFGTELQSTVGGYFTGFITGNGVLDPAKSSKMLKEYIRDRVPDIGIANSYGNKAFLNLCKRSYIVQNSSVPSVRKDEYPTPLVFHDGRLVHAPTPLNCVIILLWMPFGIILAIIRLAVGVCVPKKMALPIEAILGVSVRVKGAIPPSKKKSDEKKGVLFVCTHRTLLDPVFISFARMRNVRTVTYSVSRLSEAISPIKTARLTRCRAQDAKTMANLLQEGDLAVCPEGTTCREPYLLRFSALFAELTDQIVPVCVICKTSMFHATTARGWKGLDPIFFFMNPSPGYEVKFLRQLPPDLTCSGGRSSHEVANHVQKLLADALGFQCTNLTRKDKYRMLVGTDGLVPVSSPPSLSTSECPNLVRSCAQLIGSVCCSLPWKSNR